ncbi:MAG: hypothetical protein QOC60_680, partial [Frankiaceae bacterium]|nr:hypothetical protein [Frankiaceae bacterium]
MRTPQLRLLLTVALTFTATALVLGRIEALMLAAPAAGTLLWQLTRRPGTVTTTLRLSSWRCVEGDEVTVDVTVTADAAVDHVAVAVPLDEYLEIAHGKATAVLAVGPGRPGHVTFVVRPKRWGVHEIGPVR